MTKFTNLFAVDGRCHNSQPGTFNHECGKVATWIGHDHVENASFASGFCDACKENGWEARRFKKWTRIENPIANRLAAMTVEIENLRKEMAGIPKGDRPRLDGARARIKRAVGEMEALAARASAGENR